MSAATSAGPPRLAADLLEPGELVLLYSDGLIERPDRSIPQGMADLAAVAAEFGPGVLRADGRLDREALSRLVFADASLRTRLNAILHPLIADRMAELERVAPAGAIVVLDVPLIAENDLAATFDLVVVVDASRHAQLDRLVRLRGMTRKQAEARVAAQASRDHRLSIVGEGDIVIDNSGSRAELDRQVGDLWAELRRRAKVG